MIMIIKKCKERVGYFIHLYFVQIDSNKIYKMKIQMQTWISICIIIYYTTWITAMETISK